MLIIGNGRMITRNPECPFIENGAVAIQDNTIQMVGTLEEVKKTYARQLQLYALAMEECAGVKPDRCVLYLLGRDETVEID